MYTGHVVPISSAGSARRGSWRDRRRQKHPGYPLRCSRVLPEDTKTCSTGRFLNTYQPLQTGGAEKRTDGKVFALEKHPGRHEQMNLIFWFTGILKCARKRTLNKLVMPFLDQIDLCAAQTHKINSNIEAVQRASAGNSRSRCSPAVPSAGNMAFGSSPP